MEVWTRWWGGGVAVEEMVRSGVGEGLVMGGGGSVEQVVVGLL